MPNNFITQNRCRYYPMRTKGDAVCLLITARSPTGMFMLVTSLIGIQLLIVGIIYVFVRLRFVSKSTRSCNLSSSKKKNWMRNMCNVICIPVAIMSLRHRLHWYRHGRVDWFAVASVFSGQHKLELKQYQRRETGTSTRKHYAL